MKSNRVFCAKEFDGILWLCTNNGIVKIETDSETNIWDKDLFEPAETANDIIRFKGRLYICSSNGVYYLDTLNFTQSHKLNQFHKIQDFNSWSWKFLIFNYTDGSSQKQKLLVATKKGVFEIENDKIKTKITDYTAYSIFQSQNSPNIVYLGERNNLSSIWWNNNTKLWENNEVIKGIKPGSIKNMAEDSKGNIWIADFLNIYKMFPDLTTDKYAKLKSNNPIIEKYDDKSGITIFQSLRIFRFNNKDTSFLFFSGEEGVFSYDKNSNSFIPNTFFNSLIENFSLKSMYFDQDTLGNTCVGSKYFLQFDKNGNYLVDSLIFKRISDESQSLRIDNEFIFRGMSESVTRNNFKHKQNYSRKYNTFIREVSITGDSVIFNGTNYKYNQDSNYYATIEQPKELMLEIGYNFNSLILSFAAPFFDDEINTQFSYKLDGFDKQWSEWSNKTEKEYTNLPEGKYIFQVKAKNIYGTESTIAEYSFKILPPWYRTILAYITYIILLVLLIFAIVKLALHRVVKAKIKLEGIVKLEFSTEFFLKN